MSNKEHLKPSGFTTILSYYASINRGMSPNLSAAFPEIIGATKDKVVLPDNLNPKWVSGMATPAQEREGFILVCVA
jgi:hypothetical protein